VTAAQTITVRQVDFADPALPAIWERLLAQSDTRSVSQTFYWQRLWWDIFAEGQLLLLLAERAGEPVLLAPLFTQHGMIFFLGAGETDYHDFIGTPGDPQILAAIITAAVARTPGFQGSRLHFLPDTSRNVAALPIAAELLGLKFFHLKDMPCVLVDLAPDPGRIRQAVSRSMRKRENWFRQNGQLEIQVLTTAAEVLPLLPEFYEMHIARWRLKDIDSEFFRLELRMFLERWIEISAAQGWLRVLRLLFNGQTLATEFAWQFGNTQFSGQWVFNLDHARRSPGHVLLRHSVLMALDAGIHVYDHGLGDQEYKFRLPSRTVMCATWGIYPP